MTPVVQEHLVSMEPPILLAAGGTGGHLFPAEALAAELLRRGRKVAFVTDKRGQGFGAGKDAALAAIPVFRLPSGTPTGKKIGGKLVAGFETARGTLAAFALLAKLKPGAVIGFGGYPSLPLMLAATQMRLPTALHEQNAVLGRVNRLLARRVEKIALSYAQTKFLPPGADTLLTGNPVRPAIQAQVGRDVMTGASTYGGHISDILRIGGSVSALWRGLGATVSRQVLLSGGQLASYDQAKTIARQRGVEEGLEAPLVLPRLGAGLQVVARNVHVRLAITWSPATVPVASAGMGFTF